MEDVTIDTGRPLNARNLKRMGIINQVRAKPTLDTSWEAFRDQREIPNRLYLFSKIDPPEVVAYYLQDLSNQGVNISDFIVDWLPEHPHNFMKRMREPSDKSKKEKKARLGKSSRSRPLVPLAGAPSKSVHLSHSVKIKPLAYSLPQTTPICTTPDTPPSTTRTSNPPSLKFNLATTTLPVSEAQMLNETSSSSSSPSPQSPPYYELSSDTKPSNTQSPTLGQLQARVLASQQPSHSEPEPEVTSPPPEHLNPTTSEQTPPPAQQPIHYEPQLTNPSSEPHLELEQTTQSPSDIPPPITSATSITPTLNLSAPNSPSPPSLASSTEPETTFLTLEEAIQKGLSEQVRNDFIRDAGIRLQERLAREAKERARKEAEEKACQKELHRIREAEAKVTADAADIAAEAKAKANAEEVTRIAEEATAKANTNALTQGEHSNSGLVPLVLKTLEELQKEQQVVRVRLDQQDSININIQNMLSQLLQRMPPPPNP
ncbi:protein IQ-DOMAIN 14-like [Lathyrus oleraceus]|uniref:protein IQ-DOMAIN 14-like n=1 Tax=Pisum sativum TaxID=3888 RepID=UPI0021CF63DF|nr:protein IQ-DOMAIN 14-like [Pisum sativum]